MESLYDKLTEYGEQDFYPCHMPGHKRRLAGSLPQELVRADITEIEGFDNLHQPEGILRGLQESAAAAYGADESFYLVNGSTCGVLAAVSAALPVSGRLLMARGCHKSAYHAAYLRSLTVSYLYPDLLEGYDICEAVSPSQVRRALKADGGIGAVMVVSPTYEGRIADIAGIAETAHERGVPLIVDEAHGAHLGFCPGAAQNSCRLGADLVIHSVHKTLPALTQAALLHVNGALIDRDLLRRFLRVYQTSSPSYILMASIDSALREARRPGLWETFLRRWGRMTGRLQGLKRLRILADGSGRQDVGKLVISAGNTDLSGKRIYDMLLRDYRIQTEMAGERFCLAMFTAGDTQEGFDRMTDALLEIDGKLEGDGKPAPRGPLQTVEKPSPGGSLLEDGCTPLPISEAWDSAMEESPLLTAAYRYCGDFINLYPPGTPLAAPGEVLLPGLLERIGRCLDRGLNVQGIRMRGGEPFVRVLCKRTGTAASGGERKRGESSGHK